MKIANYPGGQEHCSPTKTTLLIRSDSMKWLDDCPAESFHAVVTDPPYGIREFEEEHVEAISDKGGDEVWQTFRYADGAKRTVQPCFSSLTSAERRDVERFFLDFGKKIHRVLKPGGHAIVAGHVSLSNIVFPAIEKGAWQGEVPGLEFRGSLIRLVTTLRGGDRPPGAQKDFPDVCTLPRSRHEPWALFRKSLPPKMNIADCLRTNWTGALRRQQVEQGEAENKPAFDVINAGRPTIEERKIANHPNLKPQRLMRTLVHIALPLGKGVILDPFSGSGSTLAAAAACGLSAVGIERAEKFYELAKNAIPQLSCRVPVLGPEEPAEVFGLEGE